MLPLSACRNLVSRTIADMSLTSCPGSPFLRLTSLTTHGSRLCAHGCQLPSTSTSSSSACTRILAVPAVTASSPWPPKAFSPGGHKRGLHKAAAAEALGPTDIETGAKSSADASARARPGDKYFAEDSRPVVLYDGVCNFCNGGVNFVLENDRTGKLRLAALQSEAGRTLLQRAGRSPDDLSSILLIESDRSYIKSEAVMRIGQLLDIPVAALVPLALLAPRVVGDGLYDVVAQNRYNIMGRRDECRVDDGRYSSRFLIS